MKTLIHPPLPKERRSPLKASTKSRHMQTATTTTTLVRFTVIFLKNTLATFPLGGPILSRLAWKDRWHELG